MAKKEDVSRERGKLRFRVLEFDLEGGNDTLHESLKTIASTLSRAAQGNGATLRLTPKQEAHVVVDPATGVEEPPAEEIQEEPRALEEGSGFSSGSGKKRSYPTPQVVDPLDLKDGAPTFQDYVANYDVDSARDQYLAALGYLKQHGNYTEASMHHVYTLFKLMKWPLSKDFSQPLRNLKREGCAKSSSQGTFLLNHIGENELQKLEKN